MTVSALDMMVRVRESSLDANQRLVVVMIALRSSGTLGEFYGAVSLLCSDTGLSVRTVQRTLRELVTLGVLVAQPPRPGRPVTYRLQEVLPTEGGVSVTPQGCQPDGGVSLTGVSAWHPGGVSLTGGGCQRGTPGVSA